MKKKIKSLDSWNTEINKRYPMSLFDNHPNPLIRMLEKNRRRHILRYIGDTRGKTFVDVGCEQGYISAKVRCKEKILVDIDTKNLEAAKKINKGARLVQSDAQKINLPDDSADIVLSAAILEHLPDPSKGFSELVRITRPNGRIIINVPNEKLVLLVKKILRTFGMSFLLGNLSKGMAPGHLHVFDKKMLLKISKNKARMLRFGYAYPYYSTMLSEFRPLK